VVLTLGAVTSGPMGNAARREGTRAEQTPSDVGEGRAGSGELVGSSTTNPKPANTSVT